MKGKHGPYTLPDSFSGCKQQRPNVWAQTQNTRNSTQMQKPSFELVVRQKTLQRNLVQPKSCCARRGIQLQQRNILTINEEIDE
jgi:hypothetical protein